ncbi:glucose uptake inhibitor SgrT [Rahnella sp. PD12R]|uniref:glucose uptake inhibitor SgrT n=1 Tax=Rahnella sp. PD12R TaxID=2855688 RepID=UPI001C4441AF|nr:glucose uptake inhibitor SgrT [Rahnella sp. PD12R]MBV6819115.1 glucose uptake inhibitor SgrT [Rahnella sp. PD12R]
MKNALTARFYQRYFAAISRNAARNHADWLSWVPVEYRLDILSRLTQWDIASQDDEQYRRHL